jgi:hypothetical protein
MPARKIEALKARDISKKWTRGRPDFAQLN